MTPADRAYSRLCAVYRLGSRGHITRAYAVEKLEPLGLLHTLEIWERYGHMKWKPHLCVDGHEFANAESNLAGDGQFPPFRVFDVEAQDYLPGTFPTRIAAEEHIHAHTLPR